jgi:phosphoglycerate dehydrogenase-like enzyme
MPRAVFYTDLAPEVAKLITGEAPPGYEVALCPSVLGVEAAIALFESADFLIQFGPSPPAEALRAARRLKLIQLVSAGFEHMDLGLCRELGIPVANNGGANAPDVAEHTVTLMLAVYRRLIEQDHNVRTGRYAAIDCGLTTYTIRGKTVGIVGLGNIGRAVAMLLRGFGARLLYHDVRTVPAEVERELGVTRTELASLLGESDIVTLHLPLDETTRGAIGAREIALMKPSAILINTCRGSVVDQAALTEALRERRILAAGLDVQEREPPDPADPLLALGNVILTPHCAGVTLDTWARRARFIFENFERVRRGEPAHALVSGV